MELTLAIAARHLWGGTRNPKPETRNPKPEIRKQADSALDHALRWMDDGGMMNALGLHPPQYPSSPGTDLGTDPGAGTVQCTTAMPTVVVPYSNAYHRALPTSHTQFRTRFRP